MDPSNYGVSLPACLPAACLLDISATTHDDDDNNTDDDDVGGSVTVCVCCVLLVCVNEIGILDEIVTFRC